MGGGERRKGFGRVAQAGREIAGQKPVQLSERQRGLLQSLGLGGVGAPKPLSHVKLYRRTDKCPVLAAARVLAHEDGLPLRDQELRGLSGVTSDVLPFAEDVRPQCLCATPFPYSALLPLFRPASLIPPCFAYFILLLHPLVSVL